MQSNDWGPFIFFIFGDSGSALSFVFSSSSFSSDGVDCVGLDAGEFSFADVDVVGISVWTGTGVGPIVGAGDVGDLDGGDVGGSVAITFAPD